MRIHTIAWALALGLGSVAGAADNPDLQADIASQIHKINLEEIQVGQLAQVQGSSSAVRAYGERLVLDHKMFDRQLVDLAKSHNLILSSPDAKQNAEAQAKLNSLASKTDRDFDEAFLTLMENGHAQAIQMLGRARDELSPSDLRSMIVKTLPILHQHEGVAINLVRHEHARG